MNKIQTDIDIDVSNRIALLEGLDHVVATTNRNGVTHKHNTGVYVQNISVDPSTNFAQIHDKKASELGFFKIDFLNVNFYNEIKDEAHLIRLMEQEPMWELLMHKEIVSKTFHINNYLDLCQSMKPTNIDQLAMLLAVRLPSKSHLRNKPWDEIEKTIWVAPLNGEYYFHKPHSYSYAMAIIVNLNLLVEQAQSPKAPDIMTQLS